MTHTSGKVLTEIKDDKKLCASFFILHVGTLINTLDTLWNFNCYINTTIVDNCSQFNTSMVLVRFSLCT
jgi:hypothetical protein